MENLFDWYRPESKWLEKHGQVSSKACLLLRVKLTWRVRIRMSANEPKRTPLIDSRTTSFLLPR